MSATSEGDRRSMQNSFVEVLDETLDGEDSPSPYADLADLARALLPALGLNSQTELCIRIVDLPEMARLHEEWMGEPGATDVLSFPMDELRPRALGASGALGGQNEPVEPGVLGDIVICPAYVETACEDPVGPRLELLIVHGMLHLIGLDHADEIEQQEMFTVQQELLDRWRGQGEPLTRGVTSPLILGMMSESD